MLLVLISRLQDEVVGFSEEDGEMLGRQRKKISSPGCRRWWEDYQMRMGRC